MSAKEHSDSTLPRGLGAVVEAMRIRHWVKNSFVVAPILFSGQFLSSQAWVRCLAAVAAYCFLSSSVYLVNDVVDRRSDLAHPVKMNRPVASGRLSVRGALLAAMILLAAGMGIAVAVEALANMGVPQQTGSAAAPRSLGGLELVVWTLLYVLLNALYSFWLKFHAIVDVIVLAMGFVLRAMGGAAAIGVPISAWLVVCSFTLCLFIALTKRRGEIISLPGEQAGASRAANRGYDLPTLEYMLTVSTAMAILTYSLYCLAPRTVGEFGSPHMIWTIPLVVYGMFRYNRTTRQAPTEDPIAVLIHDKIMWSVVIAYCVMVIMIKEFGPLDPVRKLLMT